MVYVLILQVSRTLSLALALLHGELDVHHLLEEGLKDIAVAKQLRVDLGHRLLQALDRGGGPYPRNDVLPLRVEQQQATLELATVIPDFEFGE
eukprot:577296-Pyramimonas_sp.AAC.1